MGFYNLLNFFSKLFPAPKSLSFDFVGVDICKNSVKVIKLKESPVGKIPEKYHEYFLKNQCGILDAEPNLNNCDELVSVFKTIKKDFGVDYVNVSIPELNTYIYKTKLPNNVGVNLSKTLGFSIEENVPINPNDALLDFFVTGMDSSDIDVIVTVVSKNMIEKLTEIIESAGLKPLSFEPETHAISRGIIKKGNKNQYLLLNLDNCLSSVAVVENEIVQYTQTLPVSNDFSEKFDEEEAKIIKENINKIIIYWVTSVSHTGKGGNKKYVFGWSNAFSVDLLNYLENNLPLNVKFANVWSNCFDLDEYIPSMNAKDSLQYSTAVGLSLKKIK